MCETEEKNQYQGACLCGGIQYAVSKIEDRMAHCHCSMCRKFHGAAFATFGEAKKENFQWLCGEELIRVYEGTNGTKRLFCSVCGSSLVFVPSNDSGRFVEFSLGTLDTPIPQRPDAHIFTQYSADWYEITDDLPQFLNGRDGKE
ncbi:GFA family protein [Vibrio quintilis]|uniref:Glutathione-dependent formaldehyde-activating enzyme n=1 Tax=Vibrio quintilis TaxID=1117707 RepID=A0A1M7YQU3_9VIBR|nr:GFA family protein [Vibrio quintilis]SHO55003.1 Glutathione-dependent formaldehyde-activating enzyme [Vibrio quintilis]